MAMDDEVQLTKCQQPVEVTWLWVDVVLDLADRLEVVRYQVHVLLGSASAPWNRAVSGTALQHLAEFAGGAAHEPRIIQFWRMVESGGEPDKVSCNFVLLSRH